MATETALPPDEGLYERRLPSPDLADDDHVGARQLAQGVALPRVEAKQAPGGFSADIAAVDAETVWHDEGVKGAQLDGGRSVRWREAPLAPHASSSGSSGSSGSFGFASRWRAAARGSGTGDLGG